MHIFFLQNETIEVLEKPDLDHLETDQLIEDTEATTDADDYQEPEVYNEYDQPETNLNMTESSKLHEEIIESSNKTEQSEEDYGIFESLEEPDKRI